MSRLALLALLFLAPWSCSASAPRSVAGGVPAQGTPPPVEARSAAEIPTLVQRVLAHPIDPAKPPAAFLTVNKLLREAPTIRARFAEEKQLKVLKRPLLSSGVLVFEAKHGLYRAVEEPFAQELLVNARGIAQRDAAGKVDKVAVAQQPLAKGFIDAFLVVFSGDDKALGAGFDLYFVGDETDWTMGFVPTREPLSKFVSCLVITGWKAKLETLSVSERNGDLTFTRFSNVTTIRELTDDERQRWFGWGD